MNIVYNGTIDSMLNTFYSKAAKEFEVLAICTNIAPKKAAEYNIKLIADLLLQENHITNDEHNQIFDFIDDVKSSLYNKMIDEIYMIYDYDSYIRTQTLIDVYYESGIINSDERFMLMISLREHNRY